MSKDQEYTLQFSLKIDWTYEHVQNASLKLALVDGTDATTATTLQEFDEIDINRKIDGAQTTIPFTATSSGEQYLQVTWSGTLVGSNYGPSIYDFSIKESLPKYSVIAPASINFGEVSVDKEEAEVGETVTVTARPNEGYTICSLSIGADGESIDYEPKENNQYTFTMPESSVDVYADFRGDINALEFSAIDDQEWTGEAITPEFTITFPNGDSAPSTSDGLSSTYTIEYSDNTNPGKATITVSATYENWDYCGTKTLNFTILPPSYTVNNSEEDYLTVDKTSAKAGETITVTYKGGVSSEYYLFGGINVYTYTGTTPLPITKDGDNYTFVMPEEKVYIYGKWLYNLATNALRVEIPDQTWTGEAIEPSFQIISSSDDTDITTYVDVSFADNIEVGQAKVTITAKENTNWAGSCQKTFEIKKAPAPELKFDVEFDTAIEKTYGDAPFTVTLITDLVDKSILKYSTETPSLISVDAETGEVTILNAGSASLYVVVDDEQHYEYNQTMCMINISEAEMSVEAVADEPQWYDAKAHGATVTVKSPADAVVKYGTVEGYCNLDESPTFTNAGDYTIFFTVTSSNTNYKTYEGSVELFIPKSEGTLSLYDQSQETKKFGDEPFSREVYHSGEGVVKWESSNPNVAQVDAETGEVTIVGVGEATITVKVEEQSGNFIYTNGDWDEYPIVVEPGEIKVVADNITQTYDGLSYGVVVTTTPTDATIMYGMTNGEYNLNETPTFSKAGEYLVFYEVTRDNYETVQGSVSIEITKAQGTIRYTSATKEQTFDVSTCENELINIGDGKVTFTSSNTDVATVDGEGVVTTVGVGTTTITATVEDGANYTYGTKTASYTLTIKEAEMLISAQGYSGTYDAEAHSISVRAVSPSDAVIMYGTEAGSYLLKDAPTFTDAGTYTVYYQVTKTGYKAETGSAQVKIYTASGSIEFDKTFVTKIFGDEPFIVEPTIVGDGAITYTSSDETVATVDAATGKVTIVGVGQITITAYAANGTNYSYKPNDASYTLLIQQATMDVVADGYEGIYDGDPHTISVTVNSPKDADIYYGTDGSKISSGEEWLVDAPTYTDAGEYEVWYRVAKGNYYTVINSALVIIGKAQASLSFEKESVTTGFGEEVLANKLVNTGDADVKYESSDPLVAEVDAQTGLVTVHGVGSTIITATALEGKNYEYKASNTAQYSFIVAPATLTASFNDTIATYDGEPHGATLTIDSPEGATVKYGVELDNYNLDEMPTFTNAGAYSVFAQISKENFETLIIHASVVINKAQANISFDKESMSTTYGEAAEINKFQNTGDAEIVYSSSNESVATVDAMTGEVTVVGVGETSISASVSTNSENYFYQPEVVEYKFVVEPAQLHISMFPFNGTYDGKAHGFDYIADEEDVSVKFGLQEGVYDLDESPKYTTAGTYKVFFRISKENYASIEDFDMIVIEPAKASLRFDTTKVNVTYGEQLVVNELTNTGSVEVVYSSSEPSVAEVDAKTGEVTIVGVGKTTISATLIAENENYIYESKSAQYELTVGAATIVALVEGYEGTYDGEAHGISINVESPEDVLVLYGTEKGVYELNETPTYVNAGKYDVFYQLTKQNYETIEANVAVTISKAQATLSFASDTMTVTFGDEPFTVGLLNTADGKVTYASSDSTVAKVDDVTGEVTIVHVGSADIIAKVSDTENYEYAEPIIKYALVVEPVKVTTKNIEELVAVLDDFNANYEEGQDNTTHVTIEGTITTNDNVAEMSLNDIENTDVTTLPRLNSVQGEFTGEFVATDAEINDVKVQVNGALFENVDSSAVVKDLYMDNAAIFVTELPDNWHVSNDTLYINLLADEVDGVIDGFAIAAHVAISDELKAQYPNIVICVIGELKPNAQVNGFYYDLAVASTNKAVRLREVQPIKMDNSGSGGSCKMASTYSDFGVKSAIHKYNYSEEELNKTCRQFTAEEFASGVVAYWLNYKGAGYTGEYTAKWAQGSKYPVLAKSAEDALYGITYNCPLLKEDLITKAPQFATPKNLVTIEYDEKPYAILVDGKAIELGETSASFVMTAGNKIVDIQYPELTSYTVSYKTSDGDVLKDADILAVYTGETFAATDAQLANIEKDDVVYAYVSGNVPGVAVELDANNNIVLLFAAESAKTVINFVDVDGVTVLKDAESSMQKVGETFTASESQLADIEKNGVVYKYKAGNLEKQTTVSVAENVITLVFEAVSSGITEVSDIKANSTNTDMYDLRGIKVNKPERGLYIQNGKVKLQK
ncbi:MAG: Ig-like domain-containing protein [Bacteroidales bacterium]|nr:Ig-like domain-containing protein [Bacteroidales bacterium]